MQHLKMRNILLLGFILILFASFVTASEWCYQENATESIACGGLATGNYSCSGNWGISCPNVYDDDWDTGGAGLTTYTGTLYINYSKPTNAQSSSLWQVKDSQGTANLTIPSDCWDYDATKIVLQGYASDDSMLDGWKCFNTSDEWHVVRSQSGESEGFVYEEAMWWDISDIYDISFSNNQTNASSTTYNGTDVQINLTMTSDYNISAYVLSTNDTSDNSWINETIINLAGDSNASMIWNHTIHNFSVTGGRMGWKVQANNTLGNVSISNIYSFEVASQTSCVYSSGNWDITDDCTMTGITDVGGNEFNLGPYTFVTAYNIIDISKANIRGGILTINGAKFEVGYN